MNQGWIKFHRKILDSAIWLDPLQLRAFLWLLLSANHKPQRLYIRNLKDEATVGKGEIITSYQAWAEGIRYRDTTRGRPWIIPTIQNMRTIRRQLEDAKMVTGVPTGGCLHLRIENWEPHQSEYKKATGVPTEVLTGTQQGPNREQECKNERSSNGEVYQPEYSSVLTILHGIEGWPIDPKKDDSLIQRNENKHSLTIDQLEQAAIELATWYDDNPGEIEKPKSNPRMRFNTFAKNRAKWDRESGLSDGAGGDGQPHGAISAGRIRQDLTSYLMRAARGEMDFEQFGAVILKRYAGQNIDPEAIQGAWDLAHREFGGSDGA